MLAEIRMSSQGTDFMVRRLQGLEERIADVSPAWPQVRQVLHALLAQQFASEGASGDEGPWPQLKPSTQRDRARAGFGPAHPILERTGRLRRSLTGLEGGYSIETPSQFRELTSVEYFVYHKGGPVIPRRWPPTFTADQRHALLRPIRLWITGHDPGGPRRGRPGA